MRSEKFLKLLFSNCNNHRDQANITLTAIHPDGKHRTPSRHVPLNHPHLLQDALRRLHAANAQGWGAFVAIGLRRHGLRRYQRGTVADVLMLPALFADVDDDSESALSRLQRMNPSGISFTGGGYHAFWFLEDPLTDMETARLLLRGLAKVTGGDTLNPAQSLRLISTINTKPERNEALCQLIELRAHYHPLADFEYLLPVKRAPPAAVRGRLSPNMRQSVMQHFIRSGYRQSGDWLSGPCIYPERHQHNDVHHSFGFNVRSAYGNCFRCGSILLKDIYRTIMKG